MEYIVELDLRELLQLQENFNWVCFHIVIWCIVIEALLSQRISYIF